MRTNKLKYHSSYIFVFLLLSVLNSGCKKETKYIYEVNKVKAGSVSVTKPNQKTTLEFISIVYSDLLGTTVPQPELVKMIGAYTAFGDGRVIEDLIVRNLMKRPGVLIPTNTQMRADPAVFIKNMYTRFLIRDASEYEVWYFSKMIQENTDISPDLVYYSVLTSDEYRYY